MRGRVHFAHTAALFRILPLFPSVLSMSWPRRLARKVPSASVAREVVGGDAAVAAATRAAHESLQQAKPRHEVERSHTQQLHDNAVMRHCARCTPAAGAAARNVDGDHTFQPRSVPLACFGCRADKVAELVGG